MTQPIEVALQAYLALALVAAPTHVVLATGLGYDVLRDAVMGKPVPDWRRESILRGLDRLYLRIESTKDRSTVARLTRRREALLAEARLLRKHLLA